MGYDTISRHAHSQRIVRHTIPFLVMLCSTLSISACNSTSSPILSQTQQHPTTISALTGRSTPKPTATLAPVQDRACLVASNWELVDISEYVNATSALASNDIKTLGRYGRITYTFGNDGVVQVNAEDFQLTLAVDMQGIILDVVISITGRASANYILNDPNKIIFLSSQTEKLKLSEKINGGEVVMDKSSRYMTLFGLLPDLEHDTFTYECNNDTLEYMPPFENAKPLILKRTP